jgi:thiamine biosynthesis protein ThiS
LLEHKIQIVVNGNQMDWTEGSTVSDLLCSLELNPQLVAVEQNLEIVRKAEYSIRKISTGDRIEIVHFVGGG